MEDKLFLLRGYLDEDEANKDLPKLFPKRAGLSCVFRRRAAPLNWTPKIPAAAVCWGYRSTSWAETTFFCRVRILAEFSGKELPRKESMHFAKTTFSQQNQTFVNFVAALSEKRMYIGLSPCPGCQSPPPGILINLQLPLESWEGGQPKIYIPGSSKRSCLNPKGWCVGTPYHPFRTPWKIQVYRYIQTNCMFFVSFSFFTWTSRFHVGSRGSSYLPGRLLQSGPSPVGISLGARFGGKLMVGRSIMSHPGLFNRDPYNGLL